MIVRRGGRKGQGDRKGFGKFPMSNQLLSEVDNWGAYLLICDVMFCASENALFLAVFYRQI